MTREERNNKLKYLITCMKCEVSGKSCDNEDCPTQYNAGNMEEIIENLEEISKILEQEPCEDAISRANLLEAYEDRFIELQKAHRADTQSGVNWCINTLKDMPPVVPTRKWIPCSERLPEDDDDVIITTGFEIYIGWFDADDHTWRLRNDYITSIVAWMPLPEPYKAESEEQK